MDLRQVRRLFCLFEAAVDVTGLHHNAACIARLHLDGAERAGSVEIPSADVKTLLTRYNDLGGSKQDLSVLMDKYPCTVEKAK